MNKLDGWTRTLEWASPKKSLTSEISPLVGSDSPAYSMLKQKLDARLREDENDATKFKLYDEWRGGSTDGRNDAAVSDSLAYLSSLPTCAFGIGGATACVSGLARQFVAVAPPLQMYVPGFPSFGNGDIDETSKILGSLSDVVKGTPYSFGVTRTSKSANGVLGKDTSRAGEDGAMLDLFDERRMMASLTGSLGPIAMRQNGAKNEADIALTFTGGGQALEFSFASSDKLEGQNLHESFKIDVEYYSQGHAYFKTEVDPGPTWETHFRKHEDVARELERDRAFLWNKHGHFTTTYSLGDPEHGDKFVINVGADKRFGTPLFIVQGGRSMCPGEPKTIWRESNVYLELPLKRVSTKGMDKMNLNPGERALFEVIIKNESPYREASAFALRLVDGRYEAFTELVKTAFETARSNPTRAPLVVDAIKERAGGLVVKNSPIIKFMLEEAQNASNAENANAHNVAETVFARLNAHRVDARELEDVTVKINGNKLSVGDYMPLKFVGGDSLDAQRFVSQTLLNVAVTPGFSTTDINFLQLRLQSLCETQIWEGVNLYRDPLAHTVSLDHMRWLQPCPKVQFDESTVARHLFTKIARGESNRNTLRLKVNNPEQNVLWPNSRELSDQKMNPRLKLVRLQYRPVKGGEWITAKSEETNEKDKKHNLLCDASRTEGCAFDWDVNNRYEKLASGFKDGEYELRLKTFCFGGPSLAPASVHEFVGDQRLGLLVDTEKPVKLGEYFDVKSRTIWIEFSEAINCEDTRVTVSQKVSHEACTPIASRDGVVSAEVLRFEFSITCSNANGRGTWIMKYPHRFGGEQKEKTSNATGVYQVRIQKIKDASGNDADDVVSTFSTVFDERGASVWCSKSTSDNARASLGDASTLKERRMTRKTKTVAFGFSSLALVVFVFLRARFGRNAPSEPMDDEQIALRRASTTERYGSASI